MAAPVKWFWADSSSPFLTKLKKNGDRFCDSVNCKSLVTLLDDRLIVWNPEERCLLAVNVKSAETSKDETVQTLLLTNTPVFEVDYVLSNRTHYLALYGAGGVVIVIIPKSCLKEKCLCRSWMVAEHFFLCNSNVSVVEVAWVPSHETDDHLLVLTTDNIFRLYNISEPQAPQLIFPINQSSMPNGITASLGDTAVSFDFGELVEESHQVFVLMGSGDVYLIHLPLKLEGYYRLPEVFGPLSMQPQSDDNYGVDGYSLLCLPTKVPILVIATTAGTLYHCLALGSSAKKKTAIDSSDLSVQSCDMSLYVFEKVKLELSLSSGTEDDSYSCPVRLIKDPVTPLRYICSHNSGIHIVALSFIDRLEEFAQNDSNDEVLPQLKGDPCIVENILCTRPLSNSPPTPIIGVTIVPHVPGPVLLILTATWRIITSVLVPSYQSYAPVLLSSSPTASQVSPHPPTRQEGGFEQHVQQILRGSRVPPLSHGSTDYTLQQCLEILFNTTQKYREEWLHKLNDVQLLIARRAKVIQERKEQQLSETEQLSQELKALENTNKHLKEKFSTIQGQQQKLVKRVYNILHKLHRQIPVLSTAEESMHRELVSIKEQVKDLSISLEQSETKREYQDQHIGEIKAKEEVHHFSKNQLQHIKEALSKEGEAVTDLLQKVNWLKKELAFERTDVR